MGAAGKGKRQSHLQYIAPYVPTLSQTSPETSQALVSGAEMYAELLSETLNNDTTEVVKTKPNIGTYCNSIYIATYHPSCVHSYQS